MLLLKGLRCLEGGAFGGARELWLRGGVVCEPGGSGTGARELAADGLYALPALVNAYDVLDQSTLPALGKDTPYRSLYDWSAACEAELAGHPGALAVPLVDRLFLGGLRNLLAGAAAVLHHHADHRSLGQPGFPVQVQRRYGFAHSPGLTPSLRRTYRTSDRRIPWVVRAAEGSDPALRSELGQLASQNVLRQNTVVAHGTALAPEDAGALAAAEACLAWCPESDLRLYGRTPAVAALRAHGVRVGLGSDGAAAGARDLLSSLASARRSLDLDDAGVLSLATAGSAAVARLPLGGFQPGAPADLLVTGSLPALLAGDRRAIALLLVRGRPVYGVPELLEAAGCRATAVSVDGAPRALAAELARRLRSLLKRHPAARSAAWLAQVAV